MRLLGKVAIVTGAASGMGRATALRLFEEGATVAAVDIDRAGGEETVRMAPQASNKITFVACDVSKWQDVQSTVESTVTRFGRLDILVNCAGIVNPQDELLERLSEELWDRVLGVNLFGPFHMAKYALPRIVASGGGSVVNIASNAALQASTRAAYSSSKAALISLTKAIARQYVKDNIRANVVCPGATDTPMARRALTAMSNPDIYSRPISRMAKPEEIAATIAFLVSDEASYITGAVYPIDGGLTAV